MYVTHPHASLDGTEFMTDPDWSGHPSPYLFDEADTRPWIDKAVGLTSHTRDLYVSNGGYHPTRLLLHEAIETLAFRGKTSLPYGRRPLAIITMGLPGSGKSTLVEDRRYENNLIHIDPDDYKICLPEFKKAARQRARNAAGIVHIESTDIADRILARTLAGRYDFVLDGVGRDASWYMSFVKSIKTRNYEVRLVSTHVEVPVALHRTEIRGRRTARFVEAAVIQMLAPLLPRNFMTLKDHVDRASLYDTNADTPKLVLMRENGVDQVHTPSIYRNFSK